jgi:Sec-independent protein translocase protein TatA
MYVAAFGLGPTDSIIILASILLLFGVCGWNKIAAELGKGIRAYRQSLSGEGAEMFEAS